MAGTVRSFVETPLEYAKVSKKNVFSSTKISNLFN